MPKNLTKDLRKEIISLYNSGYNISKIAKKLKHTRRTVRRWVNRQSLEDRYRAPNHRIIGDDRLPKLIDIYKKNPLTPTKVAAEEFNCSTITIRSALRRAGIRFRVLRKNPQKKPDSNTRNRNTNLDHSDACSSDYDMPLSSLAPEKIEIEVDMKCPITDPLAFVSTEMILDEELPLNLSEGKNDKTKNNKYNVPDECENISKLNVGKAKRVKL